MGADNHLSSTARNRDRRQIILVLLGTGYRRHDSVFGDFQLCSTDTFIQCIKIILISLAFNHQLEVRVAGDVHRIDGIERRFPGEQRVDINVGSDQTADRCVVSEDILHVQRTSCDGAFDDLLAAVYREIGYIIIGHLLERGHHFAVLVYADGIKMTVRAFYNELTNGQGNHIRLSHRQLCDIELAGSTLRDDCGVGGQILDVRPVDISGFDIGFDHCGDRRRQRGNCRPVDVGFINIGGGDLRFGDGGDIRRQRFDLRPVDIGVDDIRRSQLGG